jgi:hypothetical protein
MCLLWYFIVLKSEFFLQFKYYLLFVPPPFWKIDQWRLAIDSWTFKPVIKMLVLHLYFDISEIFLTILFCFFVDDPEEPNR